MKLASLKNGDRDGQLVVVNDKLTHAVAANDIAASLQIALDDWSTAAPALESLYRTINEQKVAGQIAFEAKNFASPLPRAFQFLDGSVYLSHMEKARKARGATMPENYATEPLMYQGVSDSFLGPCDDAPFPSEDLGIDFEAEIAVIVDDVPMGVSPAQAAEHIKLIVLLNDFTARSLTQSELPKGFGFLQSKPTSSFAPVAITPATLGDDWQEQRLNLRVHAYVNNNKLGSPHTGKDMFFGYPELIAHAARTRRLSAGTIIGAGAVSNKDTSSGYACIAEARVEEQMAGDEPTTPFLKFGDRVRIDVLDDQGHSVFGAIDQQIVPHT